MSDAIIAPAAAPAASATPVPEVNTSATDTPVETSTDSSEGSTEAPVSGTTEVTSQEAKDVKEGAKRAADGKEPTEEQKKAAAEIIKKYKVKVDGEEMEVSEDELLKGYQKGKAASKKFEEGAKLRKQAEQAIQLLKSQPDRVMKELGLNPRDWAESFLAGELEKELMSPEQRELMDLKAKLAEKEGKEKAEQEAKKQEHSKKLREAEMIDLDKKMNESLISSGLPKTPKTVAMVASYLTDALEMGKRLEPADVMDLVKEDYNGLLRDLLGATDGETLVKLVGEDTIQKIRKADLARVKAKAPAQPTDTRSTAKSPTEEKPQSKKTTQDFMEELRNKYK